MGRGTTRRGGSLDLYLKEIASRPLLSREEEEALAVRIRKGDRAALETLVRGNLRFVVAVARRYRGRGLPLEDLINDGNLGLLAAARRFDETRGVRFISYAVWWIRQAILRSLSESAAPLRVPRRRSGAGPRIGGHTSLDAPVAENGGARLLDLLPDERVPVPHESLHREALRDALDASLASLPEREERVLRLYYGLDGEAPRSLVQIGGRLEMSRERVRQVKARALARLRTRGMRARLRPFLTRR